MTIQLSVILLSVHGLGFLGISKFIFVPSSRIHEHSFADMRMGIKSKVLLSFTSSAERAHRKPKCR